METITIEKELDVIFGTFAGMIRMDISANNRSKRATKMRSIFYQIVKDLNVECTKSKMGKKLGMAHATVCYAMKQFEKQILVSPFYCDIYTKGLKACCDALELDYDKINTPGTRALKRKWVSQSNEVRELKEISKRVSNNETLKTILSLTPEQFEAFEERARVMLKAVKSIKTYSNTNRSDFNVAS